MHIGGANFRWRWTWLLNASIPLPQMVPTAILGRMFQILMAKWRKIFWGWSLYSRHGKYINCWYRRAWSLKRRLSYNDGRQQVHRSAGLWLVYILYSTAVPATFLLWCKIVTASILLLQLHPHQWFWESSFQWSLGEYGIFCIHPG